MSDLPTHVQDYLLSFADDEHLMGQRHTEWIGVAPFLEEDMAFASIGQDELGHAALLYELLSDDIDTLALLRDPAHYRSCHLVEEPCTDWADALVRHWLYDTAEQLRWEAVPASSYRPLADICVSAQREEAFHRRHAEALLDALAGAAEAEHRIRASLLRLLPLALGLFDAAADEPAVLSDGVAATSLVDLSSQWRVVVDQRFGRQDWNQLVGPEQRQRTQRSAHFGPMYASMREVILIDPAAKW